MFIKQILSSVELKKFLGDELNDLFLAEYDGEPYKIKENDTEYIISFHHENEFNDAIYYEVTEC